MELCTINVSQVRRCSTEAQQCLQLLPWGYVTDVCSALQDALAAAKAKFEQQQKENERIAEMNKRQRLGLPMERKPVPEVRVSCEARIKHVLVLVAAVRSAVAADSRHFVLCSKLLVAGGGSRPNLLFLTSYTMATYPFKAYGVKYVVSRCD